MAFASFERERIAHVPFEGGPQVTDIQSFYSIQFIVRVWEGCRDARANATQLRIFHMGLPSHKQPYNRIYLGLVQYINGVRQALGRCLKSVAKPKLPQSSPDSFHPAISKRNGRWEYFPQCTKG